MKINKIMPIIIISVIIFSGLGVSSLASATGSVTIVFHEKGLPTGTEWIVYLGVVGVGYEGKLSSTTAYLNQSGQAYDEYNYTVHSTNDKYGVGQYGDYSGYFNVTSANPTYCYVNFTFNPLKSGVIFTENVNPADNLGLAVSFNNTEKVFSNTSYSEYFGSFYTGTYNYSVYEPANSIFYVSYVTYGGSTIPLKGSFTINGEYPANNDTISITLSMKYYTINIQPEWLLNSKYDILTYNSSSYWYINISSHNTVSNLLSISNESTKTLISTSNSNATLSLYNGTYNYTLYTTEKMYEGLKGNFTVNGKNETVNVTFETNLITFKEIGLPYQQTVYVFGSNLSYNISSIWEVSLKKVSGIHAPYTYNTEQLGSAKNLTFFGASGTYNYTVESPVSYTITSGTSEWHSASYITSDPTGQLTVNGNNVSLSFNYTEAKYNVIFTETGLYPNINWGVDFNNTVQYSNHTQIIFKSSTGNFKYSIIAPKYYRILANSSNYLNITSTNNITINIPFLRLWIITLHEQGLASGTEWSAYIEWSPNPVIFNSENSSNTPNITFTVANATYMGSGFYLISVYSVSGYAPPSPSSWYQNVNGNNITIAVNFAKYYTLTFTETGLSLGSKWYINITTNDQSYSSTTSSMVINDIVSGNYSYTIATNNHIYKPIQAQNYIIINNQNTTQNVEFEPVKYTVRFNEIGLPIGSSWEVILNNTSNTSINNNITFKIVNGTYNYTIIPPADYSLNISEKGVLSVKGNETVSIEIVPDPYNITFVSNLNEGVSWLVKYKLENNITFTVEIKHGTNPSSLIIHNYYIPLQYIQNTNYTLIYSTSAQTILFQIPIGTYSYTYSVSNNLFYPAILQSQNFTMTNQPNSINILFNPNYPSANFNVPSSIPQDTAWELISNSTAGYNTTIVSVSWVITGAVNYYGTGNIFSVYFNTSGIYSINLTVKNNVGLYSSIIHTTTIIPFHKATFKITVSERIGYFTNQSATFIISITCNYTLASVIGSIDNSSYIEVKYVNSTLLSNKNTTYIYYASFSPKQYPRGEHFLNFSAYTTNGYYNYTHLVLLFGAVKSGGGFDLISMFGGPTNFWAMVSAIIGVVILIASLKVSRTSDVIIQSGNGKESILKAKPVKQTTSQKIQNFEKKRRLKKGNKKIRKNGGTKK